MWRGNHGATFVALGLYLTTPWALAQLRFAHGFNLKINYCPLLLHQGHLPVIKVADQVIQPVWAGIPMGGEYGFAAWPMADQLVKEPSDVFSPAVPNPFLEYTA